MVKAYAGLTTNGHIDFDWTGTRLAIYPKRKNAKAAYGKNVRAVVIEFAGAKKARKK